MLLRTMQASHRTQRSMHIPGLGYLTPELITTFRRELYERGIDPEWPTQGQIEICARIVRELLQRDTQS